MEVNELLEVYLIIFSGTTVYKDGKNADGFYRTGNYIYFLRTKHVSLV